MSTVQGNCDTCGESASLISGLCFSCVRRYGSAQQLVTRDRMLAVLSRHIGREAGVKIQQLVAELTRPTPLVLADLPSLERQAREIVVQLRFEGHHVCAHPNSGYFLAANAEELDATCSFLYERAMTSLTQVAAMKRVSLPDLRGQLHLPT